MSKKPFTSDDLQKIARQLEKKFGAAGPGKGFAIMVWDGHKLNHVTTSRAEFAAMIAAQLNDWASAHIADEDRQIALARQAQQAPVAVPPPPTTQQH